MLILDDRLTLRVLLGLFDWLPSGFDSSDLATTPVVLYRLNSALYSERGFTRGVHSSMLSSLTADGQRRVLERADNPEPLLKVLDSRTSLNASVAIATTIGRLGHYQAEILGAAARNDAAIAVTSLSPSFREATQTYELELHHVT
jgi:hypothetical protein